MTNTRIRLLPGVTLHLGSKDGGAESRVYMYGLECKALFSALVLRFEEGSREAYHSHAFNAISIIAGPGYLREMVLTTSADGRISTQYNTYTPSSKLVHTARECTHKVVSRGRTWVLSLRGPWAPTWTDLDQRTGVATTLTSGRVPA